MLTDSSIYLIVPPRCRVFKAILGYDDQYREVSNGMSRYLIFLNEGLVAVGLLSRSEPYTVISVPVEEGQKLELTVNPLHYQDGREMGRHAEAGDAINWANAHFRLE